jgi:Zn-dependent peptidase ImmA (M78 family)
MISGPWAPRELEQRANAFAAALLMPPDCLRKSCPGSGRPFTFDVLLDLAKRLWVSTDALAHHLENLGLIDQATRDTLLAQLENRCEVGRPKKPLAHRKPGPGGAHRSQKLPRRKARMP